MDRRIVYLHSEDLDGWLAPPNRPLLPLYARAFAELQGLSIVAPIPPGASPKSDRARVRHEIQIVLNSGKPPEYLEAQARAFGGRYVICGNGAAWRRLPVSGMEGLTRRVGPPCPDLARLRRLLELPPEACDVVRLRIGGRWIEAALEEKRDAEGDIVLSFFPEVEPVAHRWRFRQGTDRAALGEALRRLIREHGLALHVPPPHADGALDVLPLVEGRPVGKWTLPRIAEALFPDADLRLTHGGDAANDLPAMEAEGVLPLAAEACPVTAEAARRRGGIVARRPAPEGGAVLECYLELARRGWYGPLSARVEAICRRHLDALR